MTQQLITKEEQERAEALARKMADVAGENTKTYSSMPTITIHNGSKDKENTLPIGSFIQGISTEAGYSKEISEKPLKGVILKTRMFLTLKFKYAEGKPRIITNEFDSYADDNFIIVKEQRDGKYEQIFIGNYKQVNDKYSLKDDTTVEKKLELHHAIYVLLENGEIVRFDSKGLSRSNYFEYMTSFTRKGLDRMVSTWTIFDSEISDTDFKGKPRQVPCAAFTFTKGSQLTVDDLERVTRVQAEFEKQLYEQDVAFGNIKMEQVPEKIAPVKEELPTIQLEDEVEMAKLDIDEEEVRIEDLPF